MKTLLPEFVEEVRRLDPVTPVSRQHADEDQEFKDRKHQRDHSHDTYDATPEPPYFTTQPESTLMQNYYLLAESGGPRANDIPSPVLDLSHLIRREFSDNEDGTEVDLKS